MSRRLGLITMDYSKKILMLLCQSHLFRIICPLKRPIYIYFCFNILWYCFKKFSWISSFLKIESFEVQCWSDGSFIINPPALNNQIIHNVVDFFSMHFLDLLNFNIWYKWPWYDSSELVVDGILRLILSINANFFHFFWSLIIIVLSVKIKPTFLRSLSRKVIKFGSVISEKNIIQIFE